jgi:hypothetical protein
MEGPRGEAPFSSFGDYWRGGHGSFNGRHRADALWGCGTYGEAAVKPCSQTNFCKHTPTCNIARPNVRLGRQLSSEPKWRSISRYYQPRRVILDHRDILCAGALPRCRIRPTPSCMCARSQLFGWTDWRNLDWHAQSRAPRLRHDRPSYG